MRRPPCAAQRSGRRVRCQELKPGSANRELVERALELLDGDGVRRPSTRSRRCGPSSKAKPIADYREAIEAALSAVAEAGDGGRAYRHLGELLELFSAALRGRQGTSRRDRLRGPPDPRRAAARADRSRGRLPRRAFSHLLVDEFQDTNRLQLRLIEALRGPATQLMVVGDELQSIYGFRHADLDVFRERRERIEASPTARRSR